MQADITYILKNIMPNLIMHDANNFVSPRVENAIFELFEEKHKSKIKVNWLENYSGIKSRVAVQNKFEFLDDIFKCEFEAVEGKLKKDRNIDTPQYTLEDYLSTYSYKFDCEASEGLFVRIYHNLLGDKGLDYLKPQVPFIDSIGKRRRIDFVITGELKYAIEIEGKTYHDPSAISENKHDDDVFRQQSLSEQGYKVIRITYNLLANTNLQKEHLMNEFFKDSILRKLIEKKPNITEVDERMVDLVAFYNEDFPSFQLNVLRIFAENPDLLQEKHLNIKISKSDNGLLTLAIADFIELLEKIIDFYDLQIELPEIRIITDHSTSHSYRSIIKKYFQNDNYFNDYIDSTIAGKYKSNQIFIENADKKEATLNPEISINENNIILATTNETDFLPYTEIYDKIKYFAEDNLSIIYPPNPKADVIEYFLLRLFGFTELREGQKEILKNVISGKNILAVLPTGYGKSLCFQLPAMLIPGMAIVVTPLKSLMFDQVLSLENFGFKNTAFISSQLDFSEKEELSTKIKANKIKILYISPERFQSRKFLAEMQAFLERGIINYFIIDEAHCISEWGHDFRLSYLSLKIIVERLKRSNLQSNIPIIALTGTASLAVKNDIIEVLGLNNEEVLPSRMMNRKELSFEVVKTNGENIADKISSYIIDKLPKILKIDLFKSKNETYADAGIIFTITSGTTQSFSALDMHKSIQGRLPGKAKARYYFSKAPTICPIHQTYNVEKFYNKCAKCHSPFKQDKKACPKCKSMEKYFVKSKFYCPECNKEYNYNESYYENAEWEKEKLKIQKDFKKNKFPVLVATKGFGMGIDKPNIRFVVHNTMPISLEGYYQEAGRAGRDKQKAHSVIFHIAPHENCLKEFIYGTKSYRPPCMGNGARIKSYCAYGLPTKCDYGRQFFFIDNNFSRRTLKDGITNHIIKHHYDKYGYAEINDYDDIDKMVDFYYAYIKKTETEIYFENDDNGKNSKNHVEKIIHRFCQLGILDDYNVEYTPRHFFNLTYNQYNEVSIRKNLELQLKKTNR